MNEPQTNGTPMLSQPAMLARGFSPHLVTPMGISVAFGWHLWAPAMASQGPDADLRPQNLLTRFGIFCSMNKVFR
jgi:hypothetical protein